jgi:ubiquinone/menaquinone biosynthesis C-methylase UbiE
MASTLSDTFQRNAAVEEDLALLSQAHNYRNWLFSFVQPHLGRRVLEIGSGIGNYSSFMLDRERLWVSDYDGHYVKLLQEKFHSQPHVTSHLLDLSRLDESQLQQMQAEGMDTVVLMNVMEHIPNDTEALTILARYLQPGGQVVIEVPGLQFLFGSLDEAYGHYRRYNHAEARRLSQETGLQLVNAYYYNFMAVPSWFWVARVKRQQRLPVRSVRFFDQVVVPVVSRLERIVHPPCGSSMLIVLKK